MASSSTRRQEVLLALAGALVAVLSGFVVVMAPEALGADAPAAARGWLRAAGIADVVALVGVCAGYLFGRRDRIGRTLLRLAGLLAGLTILALAAGAWFFMVDDSLDPADAVGLAIMVAIPAGLALWLARGWLLYAGAAR